MTTDPIDDLTHEVLTGHGMVKSSSGAVANNTRPFRTYYNGGQAVHSGELKDSLRSIGWKHIPNGFWDASRSQKYTRGPNAKIIVDLMGDGHRVSTLTHMMEPAKPTDFNEAYDPLPNHPDDNLAHEIFTAHGLETLKPFGDGLYTRPKDVPYAHPDHVAADLKSAGWKELNSVSYNDLSTRRFSREHPTRSPAMVYMDVNKDGDKVYQIQHYPIKIVSEGIKSFGRFVSEALHDDLAHEIISSHGFRVKQRAEAGPDVYVSYRVYSGAHAHEDDVLNDLKSTGWNHFHTDYDHHMHLLARADSDAVGMKLYSGPDRAVHKIVHYTDY